MRIVHYIPDILKSDIVADYVNMLSKHHSENDKVRLVTDKDKVETLMTIKDTDILHVHTCWSRKTAYVVEKAVKGNVAVVLSPHGSLDSYVVDNEQPKMKKMQLLAYQKGMLRNADAVVVTNTSEPDSVAEADALMVAARGVVKRLSGGVAQVGCQSSLGSAAKDQYR